MKDLQITTDGFVDRQPLCQRKGLMHSTSGMEIRQSRIQIIPKFCDLIGIYIAISNPNLKFNGSLIPNDAVEMPRLTYI
jgi:hypothetical protein